MILCETYSSILSTFFHFKILILFFKFLFFSFLFFEAGVLDFEIESKAKKALCHKYILSLLLTFYFSDLSY